MQLSGAAQTFRHTTGPPHTAFSSARDRARGLRFELRDLEGLGFRVEALKLGSSLGV